VSQRDVNGVGSIEITRLGWLVFEQTVSLGKGELAEIVGITHVGFPYMESVSLLGALHEY
jgi:hypothetical protein